MRTGGLVFLKPQRFGSPMGVLVTHLAQLRPVRRSFPLMCVNHDNVGSLSILLPSPTGGRLVVMPHVYFPHRRTNLREFRGERAAGSC